jgi:ketosteroid isomerase-like protein
MSRANVEVVRRWVDAWDRDDLSVWSRFLADDVAWLPTEQHPESTSIRGPEQVLANLQEWLAPWDSYTIRTDKIVDAGDDTVVLLARHFGQRSGTDLEVDMALPGVVKLRGGKIVEVRWFLEEGDAFEAAGLSR